MSTALFRAKSVTPSSLRVDPACSPYHYVVSFIGLVGRTSDEMVADVYSKTSENVKICHSDSSSLWLGALDTYLAP